MNIGANIYEMNKRIDIREEQINNLSMRLASIAYKLQVVKEEEKQFLISFHEVFFTLKDNKEDNSDSTTNPINDYVK